MEKKAGILLPLFSVPGNQGIGDLGQKTLMMIDEISKAGYAIWAMLPITMMQDGNSPFTAASSFAGDPIYINIDRLAEMGLLTQSSIINCNKFKDFVDYDTVRQFKEPYFQRAFKAFRKKYPQFKAEFEGFKKNAPWLNSWTAYEVFRQTNEGKGWSQWDAPYQNWPERQEINLREHVEKVFYIQFLQFIFYKQLETVTAYAREKGLILMQDLPFFTDLDSAEVWARKKEYMVRGDGSMRQSVGTPPDAWHEHGQSWKKPMYNLDVMKDDQYRSFRSRVDWLSRYFDAIRIVHFKGMESIWRVPENRKADHGKWCLGPGKDLLDLLTMDHPEMLFTAEDLGMQKPSIRELEMGYGIPGMDVLEFRLETKQLKRPAYELSMLYTSTYDTPTIEEDYASFTNNRKIALRRFFKKKGYDHRPFHDLVCHYAIDSEAGLVMLNMSDIIGLKNNGRINDPAGDPNKNWTWKLKDFKTFPADLAKTIPWLQEAGRYHSPQANQGKS